MRYNIRKAWLCLSWLFLILTGIYAEEVLPLTTLVGTGDQVTEFVVQPEAADPVQAFGVRNSAPIGTGLVILDGKVLAPPLVVTRSGLTLQINGVAVRGRPVWPIAREVDPQEDPGEPPADLIVLWIPDEGDIGERWEAYWPLKFAWELKVNQGDTQRTAEALFERYFSKSADPRTRAFAVDAGGFSHINEDGICFQVPINQRGGKLVSPEHLIRGAESRYQRTVELLQRDEPMVEHFSRSLDGPEAWKYLAAATRAPTAADFLAVLAAWGTYDPQEPEPILLAAERDNWTSLHACLQAADPAVRELITQHAPKE
jgi:hypothetical protein